MDADPGAETAVTSLSTALAHPPAASSGISTPSWLRLGMISAWMAAGVVAAATVLSTSYLRRAISSIGTDTASSMVAAEDIAAQLTDLDSRAAGALAGGSAAAAAGFDRDRKDLATRLVAAAEHIAYGESERELIARLDEEIGEYLEQVGRLNLLRSESDGAKALAAYRAASAYLHDTLLVDADRLDQANQVYMQSTYEAARDGLVTVRTGLRVLSGGLLATLVILQLFLARKTRRVFNLALLVATGIAAVQLTDLDRACAQVEELLQVTQEQAFEAIRLLSTAKTRALDAQGDLMRALADPDHRPELQKSFGVKSLGLLAVPDLDKAWPSQRARFVSRVDRPAGLLANALEHAPLADPLNATLATLDDWAAFVQASDRVWSSLSSGARREAVAAAVGSDAGLPQARIDRVRVDLQSAAALAQREFDDAVAQASFRLTQTSWYGALAALAVVAMTWLGLRPRIREYPGE